MMLVNISKESKEITDQTLLLGRLTYKLNNQMRQFRQFKFLKQIIKLTHEHLQHLKSFQNASLASIYTLPIENILAENKRVKNHIIRGGHYLKGYLQSGIFLSFAVLALGCIAKLKSRLDQIESKLKALERIIKEVQGKGKKVPQQINA